MLCTTQISREFSGDWDVHWGHRDFDPWPFWGCRNHTGVAKLNRDPFAIRHRVVSRKNPTLIVRSRAGAQKLRGLFPRVPTLESHSHKKPVNCPSNGWSLIRGHQSVNTRPPSDRISWFPRMEIQLLKQTGILALHGPEKAIRRLALDAEGFKPRRQQIGRKKTARLSSTQMLKQPLFD